MPLNREKSELLPDVLNVCVPTLVTEISLF